jgi:hypothetical protein
VKSGTAVATVATDEERRTKSYMRPLNQYTTPGTPRHTLCRCPDAANTFTPRRRIATNGATEVQINILSNGGGGILTAHKRQQTRVMNEKVMWALVQKREKRNLVILYIFTLYL